MPVIYSSAPITIITDLQDYLANNGARHTGTWDMEVKLYRGNPALSDAGGKQKSLFTISASHQPSKLYVFTANTAVITERPFTAMIESKLRRLWTLRQTFKGDGHIYECENGGFVRISNILVQGNYKGILIDVDTPDASEGRNIMNGIVTTFAMEPPAEESEPVTELDRIRLYQKVYR